ncbi:hypothetical protein DFH08DRAFT_1001633 [Mycena albidolilacea]|uniref:Uncharacterized protein n=1 Tax=Mycena albidolilacea TaxID=1033008 RepID=A0AAD7A3B9_9AGAR|nr:hypothetical protein DFH08DRAFT_1001633 [Mycena albidolilacea]
MCDEGAGCSENEDIITYDDVAQGNVRVEISHVGSEMEALAADLNTTVNGERCVFLLSGVRSLTCECRTSHATRSRRDTVQREVLGFRAQMKAMTDAYIKWGASQGEFGLDGDHTPPAPNEIEGTYKIEVVDIFTTPWKPKVAFTTRCLEIYRLVRLRSPGVSIQPWVKTLADLHGCELKPYASKAFSKCFDVYLEILQVVDDRIKKNCCPACTYKLEGEMKMIFEMLVALDGNDSLKRILVKDKTVDENGAAHGRGKERDDPCTAYAGCNYLMTREDVDKWSREVLATLVQHPRSKDKAEDTECQEHWNNMSEELTAKMWGIFDETRVFLALCCHGFVLLVANMVRSGELAKYGLAITNQLLQAFGPDLGVGYDIGCGFSSTVRDSPLGPLAEAMNLKMLVGAFHGHAHNRSCQLKHLATYVLGLGLEDLETCERFFSKSNGLAQAVRYASVFHRRLAIVTYLTHMDTFETYANLSTFLVNNYKQALEQIDLEDSLKFAMDQAGISGPEVFEEQLKQEQEYLRGLSKELEAETDQMEYYTRLVHLASQKERYNAVHQEGSTANGTARWHAKENYNRAVQAVQEMEKKMDILVRWTVDDEEYENAEALVASRHYRLALNKLEELVIKRLFELTKMNMSGTGYKLRKHIAKALQTRSKTIRTALGRYNAAATSLDPPRRTLKWEEVVEFTFLSDFDLLRDPEGNAAIRPWATPAARALMDTHFKILRAKEEIQRLNIEIRRLVTYIRDERDFLVAKEEEIRETDPDLAFFVHRYRMERGRFDHTHMKRLRKLQATYKEQFTGTLEPGVRRKEPEIPTPMVVDDQQAQREALEAEMHRVLAGGGGEDDGWETDDGDEEEEEELARAIETVVVLATDKDETD